MWRRRSSGRSRSRSICRKEIELPLRLAIVEDGAPAVLLAARHVVRDVILERRRRRYRFHAPRFVVEPADRRHALVVAEPGRVDGAAHDRDRLIVHAQRHGEGMAVLAAVREREARRIGEAARRAVHDFGDGGERLDGARAEPGRHQQIREVDRRALGRRREGAAQSAQEHVRRPHVMMVRHQEMRQHRVRPARDERELRLARRIGAPIRQVHDVALRHAVNRRVRLVDEVAHALRQPVIAPRRLRLRPHALLHHDPLAVVGDDEAVQVQLMAVLHRRRVDLGHELGRVRERVAVEADALAERAQLVGRLARVPPAPAAHVQPELVLDGTEPALERAEHARGDARAVPVHAHHAAERLEPERMRQPPQHLVTAAVQHPRLDQHAAERGHAHAQPRGHAAAVEREIGAAGATHSNVQ